MVESGHLTKQSAESPKNSEGEICQKPKKFNISKKTSRYDRNVGKVVISREMALEISKNHFLTKIHLIPCSLKFGTQEGSPNRPPIGSLFPHGENRRHGFFQLICCRQGCPDSVAGSQGCLSSTVAPWFSALLWKTIKLLNYSYLTFACEVRAAAHSIICFVLVRSANLELIMGTSNIFSKIALSRFSKPSMT